MEKIKVKANSIIRDTENKGNISLRLAQLLFRRLCKGEGMMANILVNGFLRYNLKDWEGY